MTKESEKEDRIAEPVISIQSDWEDSIFKPEKEIWISSKFLGKEGVHSKLQSNGRKIPNSYSEEFTVLSLSHGAIKVKHNPSEHICTFVPPVKTYHRIHKKRILSLNVADSGLGVSVCAENQLHVWDLVTGSVLKTLKGHVADVYKCRFFPSGIVVLSAGADMQLKIWSAETGDCPVTLIGHKAAVNDFCIIERGRNVISVSKDGTAKLWDCGKSACLATVFESQDRLNCCCVTILPDDKLPTKTEPSSEREIGTHNKLLIIGSEEGNVYGVSVFSRKTLFSIKINSAVNVVLSQGNYVIVGCQDGRIEVYKMTELEKPIKVYHESSSPVLSGCLYKDSGFFMGRNDGIVMYYGFSVDKRISLTGSDCDPISDVCCVNNKIFTGCRDGKIRQYLLGDLSSSIY